MSSFWRLVRPLSRAVTYTRWLHLFMGAVAAVVVVGVAFPGLTDPSAGMWLLLLFVPLPLLALAASVPGTRVAEAMQARLLLYPGPQAPHEHPAPEIAGSPSKSWGDRWRVFVWLTLRLWLGFGATVVTLNGLVLTLGLLMPSLWPPFGAGPVLLPGRWGWWYPLLAPVSGAVLVAVVWGAGTLMAGLAPRLLGPSPAERLAELEARTERLLERTRLARELHDTIGHALTIAVVQAGAARAAGTPEFTDRALAAIEDTGREALTELDRVLRLLREDADPTAQRPTLAHAGRLVESARGAGAEVSAHIGGDLGAVPGPVSREGYRMLQECLTNVLRHAGPVPVSVRVEVLDDWLELEVRNKQPAEPAASPGGGTGLRGLRERAVLLGGAAAYGPDDGVWRVHVSLPLQ
ncbi:MULTISPECIES: sensor histidine kinase [Streptomyces]|uniref:sensor histidine kinase n=1 Tax=Streptomyces TaxID=1883 RepID=UPI001E32F3D9|nr:MULTISPECIES: histidine kinase [Streptomyces]UFQ13742.1 histidine kinase [Streptomyces huasconensis]WCL83337.1 histidine kinase [Streptomyces sp. JCM 35825]